MNLSRSARVLGVLSILVFVLGDGPLKDCPCTGPWPTLVEEAYLAAITLILLFSIFQLNKMIYVLSKLMDAAQDTELADEIEQELQDSETKA